jgi:hypothetical protein
MTTRKELVAALQLRYGSATFSERIKILDEFVALTAYHRKHAIRLLRAKPSGKTANVATPGQSVARRARERTDPGGPTQVGCHTC